jgi:vancomycin resistance protein YoaR
MKRICLLIIFWGLNLGFVAKASGGNFLSFKKIVLDAGGENIEVTGDTYAEWLSVKPVLFQSGDYHSQVENINYCFYPPLLCDLLVSQREKLKIEKRDEYSVDRERVKIFLEDLSRQINHDSIDAKFEVRDGKIAVLARSENGLELDIEKSSKEIENAVLAKAENQTGGEIKLIYKTIEPEIKSDEVENLGITKLIGEGRSNFKGSPKNRLFNINVATNRFNGALIRPGEEFSFVKILGEVDGEHGYLPELVIKQDKTEPEFGGGICQVSTTAFRAAIYSGLKITARRNHAYPVGYYNPQGLDATVYVPKPDLRFINNTPGYILIQTKIEGTELIFQFWGTDDGRKIEIAGPKIIERNPDGSMKTTFTQIVKDGNEKVFIKDVFNSSYDSPGKYPHPGEEILKEKPKDWSKKQWEEYKKAHGM